MPLSPNEFFRQSVGQIEPIIYRHSVTTVRKVGPSSYDEPASGTLVQIGARFLIATAGHTIPKNPNGGELWVLNRTPREPFKEGTPEFVRLRRIRPWPDIGYLEVSQQIVEEYLDCKPCPAERICCRGAGRPQRPIALVGSPCDFARPIIGPACRGIVPQTKGLLSSSLEVTEWPQIGDNDPPTDDHTDLFLPFASEDMTDIRTGQPAKINTPEGFSGGGIWDLGFEPREIWSANDVVLIGIQSSWSKSGKYTRGVQIHHWLRLIHQDYPDLRSNLNSLFPELTTAEGTA